MTCQEFERFLADALGDELSPEQQSAFEEHAADCEACRQELNSLRTALDKMGKLAGPRPVQVERVGDRLTLQTHESTIEDTDIDHRVKLAHRRVGPRRGTLLRYAASLLLAFLAGYVLGGGVWRGGTERESSRLVVHDESGPARERPHSLQAAFIRTYLRKPARSDLGKCLIAMGRHRH